MSKVCIAGAGSWGLALALVLEKNGHEVTVWSALPEEIRLLKEEHENKRCLPGVIIPQTIRLTDKLDEAVADKDVIVMAVASPYTRATAAKLSPYIKDGQIIVDVAKGIEENTLDTLSQVIKDELPTAQVAVLSGPTHAEEVSRFIPTTCVIGAEAEETACFLQNLFMNESFRIYTSSDVLGIELGGSLKNVIALAAGIADGLGYGDNTKAALITRGIHEISRLGVAMGGRLQDEVQMVVEGVYSAKAALILAKKYNISMPITEKINEILFEGKNAKDAVRELMLRDRKVEYE